jgi:prevent-host-death family protein
MKKVALEDCKLTVAEVAETDEPIVLTKSGEPVAAVVPFTQDDLDSLSLSNNPAFLSILEKSINRAMEEGWVPMSEARRRLGLDDGPGTS